MIANKAGAEQVELPRFREQPGASDRECKADACFLFLGGGVRPLPTLRAQMAPDLIFEVERGKVGHEQAAYGLGLADPFFQMAAVHVA